MFVNGIFWKRKSRGHTTFAIIYLMNEIMNNHSEMIDRNFDYGLTCSGQRLQHWNMRNTSIQSQKFTAKVNVFSAPLSFVSLITCA